MNTLVVMVKDTPYTRDGMEEEGGLCSHNPLDYSCMGMDNIMAPVQW